MRTVLRDGDDGFDLWMDWYDRRLTGHATGFSLPREQDMEISRRLVAQDNDWWQRAPALVNADVQGWLDELTPPKLPDAVQPDPQESTAPQFTLSPQGKITHDRTAGQEAVRKDQASTNRHVALRAALDKIANDFRHHNNAGHFSPIADAFRDALGETLEEIEPSLTVLHAETLRLALDLQQAAAKDDILMPLEGIALLNTTVAINAANLFIGSDPFLDAMDRLLPGPDKQEPLASPEAVTAIAVAADADGVADEVAVLALKEAARNAPSPSIRTSRQSGLLSGMALNFVRYGIEAVFTYPGIAALASAAGVVASAATFGVVATVAYPATIIVALYNLARYFQANETHLRELAAMSPKTSANLELLMEIVRKLPVKSLKDE